MNSSDELPPKINNEVNIAVVIAIILGVCIAIGIFVMEIQTERYSSVYITPGSYSNYLGDAPVSFVYGIQSHEKETMDYGIIIRAGANILETKSITLNPGEIYEERKIVELPKNTDFPVNISVQSISEYETNEVHFWVRNSTSTL